MARDRSNRSRHQRTRVFLPETRGLESRLLLSAGLSIGRALWDSFVFDTAIDAVRVYDEAASRDARHGHTPTSQAAAMSHQHANHAKHVRRRAGASAAAAPAHRTTHGEQEPHSKPMAHHRPWLHHTLTSALPQATIDTAANGTAGTPTIARPAPAPPAAKKVNGSAFASGSGSGSESESGGPTVTVVDSGDADEEAGTAGTFTISRTGDTSSPLTVSYTLGGTAQYGVDYQGPQGSYNNYYGSPYGSATIPAGSSSVQVSIMPIDDHQYESNESLTLTLESNSGYQAGGPATMTIAENDVQPVITVTDTADADEEAGTTGTFTISRSGDTTLPLTISYTLGGTAQYGVDYQGPQGSYNNYYGSPSGSVTIPAASSSVQISIVPIDDHQYESNESVTLTLNPSSEYQTSAPATMTIAENDVQPVVTVTNSDDADEEGGTAGTFTISRTGDTTLPLTVSYMLGGTAQYGVDYQGPEGSYNSYYGSPSGSVTIPAGSSSVQISIVPIDDNQFESDETVTLSLDSSGDYQTGSPATMTIAENDVQSVVTVTDSADADEEGGTVGTFTISRTGDTSQPLTVSYTLGGTAQYGVDYQGPQGSYNYYYGSPSGSVTIPAGSPSVQISIVPIDDNQIESNETVSLTLDSSSEYQTGAPATMTIAENDVQPTVTIVETANADEQNVTAGAFTVTRSGDTSQPLTVYYSVGGTAAGYEDYSSLPGSVTIPAGSSSATINVTPIVDQYAGGNETVVITLSDNSAYVVGAQSADTVTINDVAPVVTIQATTPNASEPGLVPGVFAVERTGDTSLALTVTYTVSGTASSYDDYNYLSGSVTIPAGSATATITVTPRTDTYDGGNETVVLTLNTGSTYALGTQTSDTVTIYDPPPPTVTIQATTPTASEQNQTPGIFTVTRTGDTSEALTINYTVSGTASSSDDYAALSGSVTIPAGSAAATISVTPQFDQYDGGNEAVVVTLSNNASYVVGSQSSGTVSISDTAPVITIKATTPTAIEEGQVPGVFTVTRTGNTSLPLTVYYSVSGTASIYDDYTSLPGTVTIPAGSSSATINVTPQVDQYDGGNETVMATLSSNSRYVLGAQASDTVTISDTEPVVTIQATTPTASETNQTPGVFTVTRTGDTTLALTVYYSVSGTASWFDDYSSLPGSVTIPAGSSSATINVNPLVDQYDGGNETVVVTLGANSRYALGGQTSDTVTISDVAPVITIQATTPTAIEEGQVPGVFTVTRTGNTSLALTVYYSVSGTASYDDYSYLPGTVTIPAGSSSATINVTPQVDQYDGGNETVMATLSSNSRYVLGAQASDTVTISDTEPVVTIQATTPTASETNQTPGVFTVTRTGDTTLALTVSYALTGTAAAYEDYNALSGSITIPAGSSSATINVTPVADQFDGGNETVVATLSTSTRYALGAQTSDTVTISDTEPVVTIQATTPTASEPDQTPGVFTVTRTGDTTLALTVFYTVSGTAVAYEDYNALSGSITIPAGSSSATFNVTPVADQYDGGNETVVATLNSNTRYAIGSQASDTVTISDVAPVVTIQATTPIASEPNLTPGAFTVTRTGSASLALTVYYTVSGTASSSDDYNALYGYVTIPAGSASATIDVTPRTDVYDGGNETVVLTLSTRSTYVVGAQSSDTVTINDIPPPTVTIQATTPTASEQGQTPGVFTVTRAGDTTQALTVYYSVSGTAWSYDDYTALPGSVTIPAGSTSATINVAPKIDPYDGGNETVVATLNNNASYVVGTQSSDTVTIADTPPTVSIQATTPTASEPALTPGVFTVTRTGDVSLALTVYYSVSGTASWYDDYSSLPGSVTIPAGSATATINVTPMSDVYDGGDETVILTLTNSSAYAVGSTNSDTVTIYDPPPPTVTIQATTPTASEQNQTPGIFTVTRTGDTSEALTINYTVSGTASSSDDYAALPGSVTIPAGSATVTVELDPLADSFDNWGNETVIVTLSPPTGNSYQLGTAKSGTVTIVDDTPPPTVTITATTPTASEPNQTPGVFTVTRTGNTSQALTVLYTVTGTAAYGEYTTLPGYVTIPSGSSTATIAVNPAFDAYDGGNETVIVTLTPSSTSQYLVDSPNFDTVTIDDPPPATVTVQATTPTASEQGLTPGVFTFTRTGDTSQPLTVNYSVGGTASSSDDYTALPRSVTIPSGSATATVNVSPLIDAYDGGNETVVVAITASAQNGSLYIIGSQHTDTVTLNDTTPQPVVTIQATTPNASEQGLVPGVFTVTRSGDTTFPLTVYYSVGGTASSYNDYTVLPGSVTIPAGATTATVTVTPEADAYDGGNKTVIATLYVPYSSNKYALGSATSDTVTIDDTTPQPVVSIQATTPTASEQGQTPGVFTVTRTGDTTFPLTVYYTASGTAAYTDYSGLPGYVTIPAGATAATFNVNPLIDQYDGGNKTVIATLTNPSNGAFALGSTTSDTVTINDTTPQPVVSIQATTPNAAEQGLTPGVFTVTRTGDTTLALTVYYHVSGTASAADDYNGLAGYVTIPAGATTATVTVTPRADAYDGGNETVALTLYVPTNSLAYALGTQTSDTVTINDTTPQPQAVSIYADQPIAVEQGLVPADVTVSRTGDTSAPLTVYMNISGTARADEDYVQVPTAVTIPAGASSTSFPITPLTDAPDGGAELFYATLAPAPFYQLGTQTTTAVEVAQTPPVPDTVTIQSTKRLASGPNQLDGQFTVTRSGDTFLPLTVYYTLGGTAVSGRDYQPMPGYVTIPSGQTTAMFSVLPLAHAADGTRLTVTASLASGPPDGPGGMEQAGRPAPGGLAASPTSPPGAPGGSGYTIGSPSADDVTIDESYLVTVDDPSGDESHGSWDWAAQQVNQNGGGEIDFAITSGSTLEVGNDGEMDESTFNVPVTIDGSTQEEFYGGTPQILTTLTLEAGSDGSKITGLEINELDVASSDNTIGGVDSADGNTMTTLNFESGSSNNVVQGNTLTGDDSGTGIAIDGGSDNTIGGTEAGAGNVISGYDTGISITGGGSWNLIQGNKIGTNAEGDAAQPNSGDGILIEDSSSNTVGGTDEAARNIISGNEGYGVHLGHGASSNLVAGNYIGLGADGETPLGNQAGGVEISDGASDNEIGGNSTTGATNFISGNQGAGIVLEGEGTDENLIEGNDIGLASDETTEVDNSGDGVDVLNGASNNTIGDPTAEEGNGPGSAPASGPTAGPAALRAALAPPPQAPPAPFQPRRPFGNIIVAPVQATGVLLDGAATTLNAVPGNFIGINILGVKTGNANNGVQISGGASRNSVGPFNLISGSAKDGVLITGAGSALNLVIANYIGTDPTGTTALANGANGVEVSAGATGNTIGGTGAIGGNLISGNAKDGVLITGAGTAVNSVLGNYIGTDGGATTAVPNGANGVEISEGATNNSVGGSIDGALNVISGNTRDGVLMSGDDTTGNQVAGNYIGTDKNAANPVPNRANGVEINSGAASNFVGGVGAAFGNVISGNSGFGVLISGDDTDSNAVQSNTIGLDATGLLALPNGAGVEISDGAAQNLVGGSVADSRNVISGNLGSGVILTDNETDHNNIWNNYIGLDTTGVLGIGNGGDGVDAVNGASDNPIGGTEALATNVISGNGGSGVFISDPFTTGDDVEGNLIGTDQSGLLPIGNAGNGVTVVGGAFHNDIGGTEPAAGNLISANLGSGVVISDPLTTTDDVEGNRIGTDISGLLPLGNAGTGVSVLNGATGNDIGGSQNGAGNLICANGLAGVLVSDLNTSADNVEGNRIGASLDGTNILGNGGPGVWLAAGASNTEVGGTASGAINVISGNVGSGVIISGPFSTGDKVEDNLIGLDPTGTFAMANGGDGVDVIGGATNIEIGGNQPGEPNVISGNVGSGVFISDPGTTHVEVKSNDIGLNLAGTAGVPNGGSGVVITNGASNDEVGGAAIDENGNPTPGEGNTIDFNGGSGVIVSGAASNKVEGNVIQYNAVYGVGLLAGATSNEVGSTTIGAGNIITNNSQVGVALSSNGTSQNKVEGNTITTNGVGVDVAAAATSNTIGGAEAGAGNVISGNAGDGVDIHDTGTSQNKVEGNHIGVNGNGNAGQGNSGTGVKVFNKATSNTIGGDEIGAGNIISGNGNTLVGPTAGVWIRDAGTSSNSIEGNFIGIDATGAVAIPNIGSGVRISDGATDNEVGSAAVTARNEISGNSGPGVLITGTGTTGNKVENDTIGADITESVALANTGDGVRIEAGASENTVGEAQTGSLISGNGGAGVLITDPGTSGNTVGGNSIGVDKTGTKALGNTGPGVLIQASASENTIGGTEAGSGNLISSNAVGVKITDSGTTGNYVEGDWIGTNLAGTGALANTGDGVEVANGASDNTIGGTEDGAADVISGNGANGIELHDSGTTGNVIQGDRIGTTADGTSALANAQDGVSINRGASDNTVGGTDAGAGNTIADNTGNGVTIGQDASDASTGNAILGNAIYGNAKLGIDLGNDGVTPNSPGGHSSGPNKLQNTPVLTSATSDSSSTTVVGTLNGAASTTFRIEFFSSPSADPSGSGQGQTYLGSISVTTDGSGNASFTATLNTATPAGQVVAATATDANNNTSEFAQDVTIPGSPSSAPSTDAVLAAAAPVSRFDEATLNDLAIEQAKATPAPAQSFGTVVLSAASRGSRMAVAASVPTRGRSLFAVTKSGVSSDISDARVGE